MNIAFVPARGGSKSIPLKNIKLFCRKPLIYWSLVALQNAVSIDQIIVATDSQLIKNEVESFEFSKVVIYNRDAENAQDHSSTESVLLEYFGKANYKDIDLCVLVQATSPFIRSSHFDEAIAKLEVEKYDSLLSVVCNKRFFWNMDGTSLNYDYRQRPRRQEFTGTLMENGAFYINSIGNIKRDKNRLSNKIGYYQMEEYSGLELDEPSDWFVAENIMRQYLLPVAVSSDIKLFLADVDGTLTDAGMYYDELGNEQKKFNTQDGLGFALLRHRGIKTGILTGEKTEIVARRADKLEIDYLYQGVGALEKLQTAKQICEKEGITLDQVAFIGDDINDIDLLNSVGLCACPANAVDSVKELPGIILLGKSGGCGAVREFIEVILKV